MSDSSYLEQLFSRARAGGVPLNGTFELTSRCNLNCKMCYIHSALNDSACARRELSADEWTDIAESAAAQGMLLLLLTGGEPFVYGDFFKVYEQCKRLGLIISINTNGTAINSSALNRLLKDPPSKVNVSLYGASCETYERLCGNGRMYEKVTETIKKLREGGINVCLNFSITQHNCDDMDEIFRFARESRIPVRSSTYMFPPLRAQELSSVCGVSSKSITNQRAGSALAGKIGAYSLLSRYGKEKFLDYAKLMQVKGCVNDEINSCIERSGEQVICRAGRCTFWVSFDGRLLPCGMMCEPSVSLKEHSFEDAWGEIKAKVSEIKLPKKCASCAQRYACEVCAASCYAEGGRFDALPEYQCQKASAFIDTMDYLRKAIQDGDKE